MDWAGEVGERMMTVDGPEALFFSGKTIKKNIRDQVIMEIKWRIPGNVSTLHNSSWGYVVYQERPPFLGKFLERSQ